MGYCIRTYRLLLDCDHPEWLMENQKRYQEVEQFYYDLLLGLPQLHTLGSQQIMRELEKLTISVGSDDEAMQSLPYAEIPAYFRRAAINSAIAALKSLNTRTDGHIRPIKLESRAVFYQRMYRDFDGRKITLHIWNGNEWVWMKCRLHGNQLPSKEHDNVKWLSPTVTLERDYCFLHVPVKEPVLDDRKLKQRMTDKVNLCSVQFMNKKSFAVACILDSSGKQIAVRYIQGGTQYAHQCKILLSRIEHSSSSHGSDGQAKANQRYWMRLKYQNEYWAHKASREILDFCTEYKAKVLTWEEYEPEYSKAVLKKSGNWSPLHLSTRIKNYLSYKAWADGILIAPVKTFQIKERTYTEGDKDLQRARIVGKQCIDNFAKRV